MSKKPKPSPALFGEMPELRRPERAVSDSHVRLPCNGCGGRGFHREKDPKLGKIKKPCSACAGAGRVLTIRQDATDG